MCHVRGLPQCGLNDNVAIMSLLACSLGLLNPCHFEELTEELNVFVPARSGMGGCRAGLY
jgi:hypothetical protein